MDTPFKPAEDKKYILEVTACHDVTQEDCWKVE